ncbi:MAG: PDDEXK family nuclease [Candidatus Limnocylindrales bacterium]
MTDASGLPDTARPAFAHASEAELARILDFYDVRWRYEPDTFPIGWSLDGEVVESFSPDFYLPDLDMYLELTTLKQSLVRKKNRKLRRLRELYPDVRIKLFYARDFRMLLLKFGRLALAAELSGTVGQATPPRVHANADADGGPELRNERPATKRTGADVDGVADADAEDEAAGGAEALFGPGDPLTEDDEAGFTPRGRRRGRRRRAAARAAALAASTGPHATGVTTRPANGVSSAGTLPT